MYVAMPTIFSLLLLKDYKVFLYFAKGAICVNHFNTRGVKACALLNREQRVIERAVGKKLVLLPIRTKTSATPSFAW
jgi:hypothetical protein